MSATGRDTAVLLLALWEQAGGLPPLQRDLVLAQAGGGAGADLLHRPVGTTNHHLVELRRDLLGGELPVTARCPDCAEQVEVALQTGRFDGGGAAAQGETGGVRWRAPTPADLLAVAGDPDPEAALRERCVHGADLLDAAQVDALLAAADPLAETMLELTCPVCGTAFRADLDIGSFVWLEIEAAARRVLLQVDTLARSYGWTEPEVLALPPQRRAAYLRMATGGLP